LQLGNFAGKNGNPVYSLKKMETLFFPARHLSGVCLRGVPVPAVLLPQLPVPGSQRSGPHQNQIRTRDHRLKGQSHEMKTFLCEGL
jgi:hypothetical protein